MATQKKILIINGAERMFLCDPEQDSLADVLRGLGLTGTKVGCGTGQCGACSVILDGEVVRSCVKKIRTVKDYSRVVTIEGLGTADNLHPLQLSWMVHGGVQCGFCTPGFIVSAKGLLDKNPSPTREEVRAWFLKHRNACRCTGYKPLVDAVMDAARVLRGELSMEQLAWQLPADGKIYNTHIPRPAALAKVLGAADYGDDIAVKGRGFLYLAPVMPDSAHANILSMDFSEAERAPGVVQIITAADVKGINRITFPLGHPRAKGDGFERPILVDKKIFRRGDIVALIAADTPRQAREAAKLVKLELEPLPEYLEALDAMAEDAVEIHPGVPNVFYKIPLIKGEDTREVLPKSAHVVEGSFYSTRQPHLPIEPDVAQAYVDEGGTLTIHLKTHGLHMAAGLIAAGVGMPVEKIRMIQNPTGGSFGYSLSPGMAALVGVATLATGRPVSMTFTYAEHQQYTGKRAASYANGKLACDEHGRLTAAEVEIAFDKGCYSEMAVGLAEAGLRFFGFPYAIPNMLGVASTTFSNQPFSTAYRGYGAPQTMTSSEGLMDMLAEQAGIDPFEFRYLNVFRPGDTANAGHTFSVYPMEGIFDKLRPRYLALKQHAEQHSTDEVKYGVGVACGAYQVGGARDHAEVALELNPDGSVTNYNTWEDIGQGGDVGALVHTHEALRPLGLKPEQIKLVMNDTAICPPTGLAAGSRSHFYAGNAILDAAEKLMDAMRKPDGSFRSYDEMVAEGIPTKYLGVYDTPAELNLKRMDPNTGQGNPTIEYSYSAYVAEVAVEVKTGKVQVVAMHGVADVGVVGNYLAVDGQAYGGMEHVIGFALSEDYTDHKKHGSLAGAGFPYIDMVPDGENFTIEYQQTERPHGPQHSGGASECFQSGGHMSVINAIYNATGARIFTLPATPDKVKAAIDAAAAGQPLVQERYYFGEDFYDAIDYMKANPV
ncbi:MAG: molybdopterin-dependent oxidoreductase [Clostridiales bacterium]|nr:molybdopterin-dependent oxidoreductase [Clostridiales bacterium]